MHTARVSVAALSETVRNMKGGMNTRTSKTAARSSAYPFPSLKGSFFTVTYMAPL